MQRETVLQTSRSLFLLALVGLTLLSAAAGPARAQDVPETGGRVFGLVGGVFGDGDTTVLTSGGAGIRITPRLGLDLEVLYAPDLGLPTDLLVIQTFGVAFAPIEREERSRLVAFLTKMTVEFPVANGRVWPYLTGGGGVGSLRQTVTFRNLPLPLAEGLGPQIFPGPEIDITATDLALTFGGGVDVRLWNGLAVGGAVSYLRLFDDTDAFDFAFVTSRISYRF